jgi:Uma2 family endonuclease
MYDRQAEAGEMERPASRDTRLTYEDFLLFPDDGMRHEIIDGEHYVTPSPNSRHQVLVGRLYFEIESILRRHPGVGRVFLSPLDVIFTPWDIVEPDLLFVAGDQSEIVTEKNVQGAPALVIEVLSPGTRKRDEGIKLRLFDRGAAREYWLVDPERDRITVCRRQPDGSFPRVSELSRDEHDVLATPLIPHLAIPLVGLFADP